ncbi:hypothetical protein [Gordonia neofelifaecis]|uniref:Deazaflavin-dependent nitroreductase family protein n=1 Tax=Gordonia neofelifaecis NRRL B-59395 TaxID=644548 RepID=F1YEQ0_9ACTN|nr:hypothetical protein [Gordonia neofelifaecis]EGD56883.1 hypothetical protein SCNU_00855 [Gordonia neofelifaecis NRRL B-59395]
MSQRDKADDRNDADRPGGRLLTVSNAAVGGLVRLGAAPRGCHELSVSGRTSGRITTRPVNVLEWAGHRYLLSPRGDTQWVRNVRVSGEATLRRGRRTEAVELTELADGVKPELIREYLRRWGWQVKAFVDGLTAESSDAELAGAASRFPVFELVPSAAD